VPARVHRLEHLADHDVVGEIAVVAHQQDVAQRIRAQRIDHVAQQQLRGLGADVEAAGEFAEHAVDAPGVMAITSAGSSENADL
jgi:hypothetical protein